MDSFERGTVVAKLTALTFLTASIMVIAPLALYFLLWFSAVGNPHRIDPALDLYASIWSAAAILAAVSNILLINRFTKGRSPTALLIVAAVSMVSVVTCPEWFY